MTQFVTYPVLAVAAILSVGYANGWRTSIRVSEVERGHDSSVTIWPSQHKYISELIQITILIGQLSTAIPLSQIK